MEKKKTMQITISKSQVFAEVQKLAAYVAAKQADASADDGAYPRIAIQDEDREVLESAWQDVLTDVMRLFAPYVTDAELPPLPHGTDLAADFVLNVALPESLLAAHEAALPAVVMRYVVRRLLAAWTAIASPEHADRFAAYAKTARIKLHSLFLLRIRRMGW